jgi:hypothetical protein
MSGKLQKGNWNMGKALEVPEMGLVVHKANGPF